MPGAQTADAETGCHAHVELALQPTPQAPGLARAAVRELCAADDEPGARQVSAARSRELQLLVSEIVTNAVRHTDDPTVRLTLTAEMAKDSIRVAITDSGHGFGEESKRHAGGYGLFLLDKLASRWRVEQLDDRSADTRVWFELPLRDAA